MKKKKKKETSKKKSEKERKKNEKKWRANKTNKSLLEVTTLSELRFGLPLL